MLLFPLDIAAFRYLFFFAAMRMTMVAQRMPRIGRRTDTVITSSRIRVCRMLFARFIISPYDIRRYATCCARFADAAFDIAAIRHVGALMFVIKCSCQFTSRTIVTSQHVAMLYYFAAIFILSICR